MESLKGEGYTNLYEAKPWSEPLAVTRIVAEWGDVSSAEAVRRALGYGEVRIENTGELDSDVTIQLGRDALNPKRAVVPKKVGAEISSTSKQGKF